MGTPLTPMSQHPPDPLWPAVERLFLAALDLDPAARAAALRGEQRIRLASFLAGADVVRVHAGAVEVALADALAVAVATEHAAEVQAALSVLLGEAAPPLRFVAAVAGRGREPAATSDPFERLKTMRHEHPVVRALFERFGAEIVWQ